MKRPSANRITTETPHQPGLNNALGSALDALPTENLPLAPAENSTPTDPGWKLGRVVLRRETAHRGGKTVIIIHDFATHLPESVIERLGKKLRAACGCGGSVKDRRIEIQGDQPAKIRALLETEGYQVAGIR